MKKRKDLFNEIFKDIFGEDSQSFFTSFKSTMRSNLDSIFDDDTFPKDGDPNFKKTEEVSETPTHTIKKVTYVSVDGTQTYIRTETEPKFKKKEKPSKEELESQLALAIKEQNFEKACELRDTLKTYK